MVVVPENPGTQRHIGGINLDCIVNPSPKLCSETCGLEWAMARMKERDGLTLEKKKDDHRRLQQTAQR